MLPTGDAVLEGKWSLPSSGSEPVGNRRTHVGKSGDGEVRRTFEELSGSPSEAGRKEEGLLWKASS